MLKHWSAFSRFHKDGRICLTNNAAERALRGAARLWAGRHGSSPEVTSAAIMPQQCIPSS